MIARLLPQYPFFSLASLSAASKGGLKSPEGGLTCFWLEVADQNFVSYSHLFTCGHLVGRVGLLNLLYCQSGE